MKADRRRSHGRIRAPIVGAAVALTVLLSACASSGLVYQGDTGPYWPGNWWADDCLLSAIDANGAYAEHTSYARAHNSPSGQECTNPVPFNAGWIGVSFDGYYNGSYCGGVGGYYYTSSRSSWAQLVGSVCGNPPGLQAFHTRAYGRWWNGSAYVTGIQNSPAQNY